MPHPRAEVERLLQAHQGRALLSIQAAVLGPHYSTLDVALHDFRMARELGLIASLHQGGGAARTPDGWERLEAAGLLGPHINIVHGHALTDAQLQRFCDLGMSFSRRRRKRDVAGPRPSAHRPLAPVRPRALAGRRPGKRAERRHADAGPGGAGHPAQPGQRGLSRGRTARFRPLPPSRRARRWPGSRSRARACCSSTTGSARWPPGKQADLVLIRASDLNMQPVHDPVSSVVFQASLANIDSVMVAGHWKKRDGKLLAPGLERDLQRLCASGEKITRAMGL